MYVVVYVLSVRQNAIIPYTWLRMDNRFRNLINYGVNRGISFGMFYTNNPNAFANGIPRGNYIPNPSARLGAQFPNEGFYHCRLRRFFCKYLILTILKKILKILLFFLYLICFLKGMLTTQLRI